ncbi:TB2/DP1, HVA22 family-domain-containing protein [Absidia repens]|uniref:Protein YOP1 n=1 Tax=Absidia repens TaxID=90262 RepID=A0A1X2IHU1_9FUNG|nr:TB2/DP1, HVA22 family-domain-containing protein [Absidia repens]
MSKRSKSPSISSLIPSDRSFRDDKNEHHHLERQRMFATSLAVERFTDKINRGSPINIRPVTLPICKASTKRIHSLESFYIQSRFFRFLLRKGLPPVLLFLGTTSSIAWLLRRFYSRHRYLALNSLGVLYPAWRCWHLVKKLDTLGEPLDQLKECKTWLAYWLLYGSLQVLDNWGTDIEQLFPNYYIYKLVILYWAQSPHSNGATILYQRVLQKPEDEEEEQHCEDEQKNMGYYDNDRMSSAETQQQQKENEQQQRQDFPPRKYQPLFNDNDEELTLTIGHTTTNDDEYFDNNESHQQKEIERIRSFRILDGYTPTLTNDEHHPSSYDSSCSSSSGNSRDVMGYILSDENNPLEVSDNHLYQQQDQQQQKQDFSTLASMETETAW